MNIMDLYARSTSQEFNDNEIAYIQHKVPINQYSFHYAIWKQIRHNKKYVVIAINYMPYITRKAAVDHSLEFIAKRQLTEHQHWEEAFHMGAGHRKYLVYSFNCIEKVIKFDKSYGVETPKVFIDTCIARGFTDSTYSTELNDVSRNKLELSLLGKHRESCEYP